MRLEGKRSVVTGAAGTLGQVIAQVLAAEGSSVACIGHNRLGLEATAELVRQQGQRAHVAELDLTDYEAVAGSIAEIVGEWGAIDILVNNAGGGVINFFHEMSHDTWMSQMDRNLNSVFNVTRAALPSMMRQHFGRVINISSVEGVRGGRLVPGAVAYAAAKAGVIGMTKALAIEVAQQGITVNCLAPGAQDTPGRKKDSPEFRARLMSLIPTQSLGRPSDLAQTVVFFAAPESVNITGVIFPLDGGHSI